MSAIRFLKWVHGRENDQVSDKIDLKTISVLRTGSGTLYQDMAPSLEPVAMSSQYTVAQRLGNEDRFEVVKFFGSEKTSSAITTGADAVVILEIEDKRIPSEAGLGARVFGESESYSSSPQLKAVSRALRQGQSF